MNSPTLILSAVAMALAIVLAAGKPVVAGTDAPGSIESGESLHIRAVQRSVRAMQAPARATPIRDPFAVDNATPAESPILPDVVPVPAQPATPAFPEFHVFGKQEDEEGWAVFIGEPGKQGQVWVVHEGESFNKRFKVAKLAPPVLIIKSTSGGQSRTFDIGKDDSEE